MIAGGDGLALGGDSYDRPTARSHHRTLPRRRLALAALLTGPPRPRRHGCLVGPEAKVSGSGITLGSASLPRNTTGQSTLRCPAQREITSAANGSGYRARRRRLNTHHPPAHNAPAEAIPSVAGSGTGLARRKPSRSVSNSPGGSPVGLAEDDKVNASP